MKVNHLKITPGSINLRKLMRPAVLGVSVLLIMSMIVTLYSSPTQAAAATPTPIPSSTLESQLTGTNIVQNGGFESGISPWTLAISDPRSQGYAGTLTRSSNAYSGSYSGLFTIAGNPQRGSGFIAVVQTIPAQAGQTYTLQLYYKGSVTVGPHVFCFGSSWNNLGLFIGPALLPKSTWTPMTMTFSVPSGTVVTEIHFDVASTGVFQVDNVIATNSNPTPSPSPSPTPVPTPTPTLSPSPTPTVTPTPTPSTTPKPTATPTPTPSPTPKPTATPTPTPTVTPTPTATPTPPPVGTYTYIVSVSGSNYQMKNGATGQVIYQSTNAAQVINNAVSNSVQGNSILISSGTYTLKASITATNKNGITLNFESGATLFVANGVNTAAIFLTGCNNWLIKNPTINGNAANQADGGWPPANGITIYGHCSNVLVDGATIDNCKMYGFVAWSEVTNCGIKNSKVTNCGWNCIQLGNDVMAISTETGLYAINNECAYCSDVGITTYGIGNFIQGNYIHDMYGTTGYINSQWGIGVEGGHGHTITGNTLVNCPRAMSIEQTDGVGSNTITDNTITTCGFGIVVVSPNNTLKNNTISNFDMYGWSQQAIVIEGAYGGANNNKVLGNTISSTNTVAHAIHINSADDTQFTDNKISVPRVGTSWYAIQVSDSSRTQISRNTISGFMGIIIDDATCQSNTITNNDFTKCNSGTGAIANYGTSTTITGNLT